MSCFNALCFYLCLITHLSWLLLFCLSVLSVCLPSRYLVFSRQTWRRQWTVVAPQTALTPLSLADVTERSLTSPLFIPHFRLCVCEPNQKPCSREPVMILLCCFCPCTSVCERVLVPITTVNESSYQTRGRNRFSQIHQSFLCFLICAASRSCFSSGERDETKRDEFAELARARCPSGRGPNILMSMLDWPLSETRS